MTHGRHAAHTRPLKKDDANVVPELAIDTFAGAVFDLSAWPDALQAVASACDARMVTVVHGTREGELSCSKGAQGAIDAYLHRREVPDSRQARVSPGLGEGFRTDLDDFTAAEIARDPYYQEFLAPLDVRWHAVAALPGFDAPLVVSLKRSARQGPFEGADLQALNHLLPHWRRAARQAAIVAHAHFQGELDAYERLGIGAALLGERGRLLAANRCLNLGDGLCVSGSYLHAQRDDERRTLDAAITAACGPAVAPGSPVAVRRPSGRRPYLVDVIATPAGDLADPGRCRALVVVTDLDQRPAPRREALQRSFGLTARETDVALLFSTGATPREIAQQLQLTEAHVRQRLKAVFAKSDTGRQAELAALLARLH